MELLPYSLQITENKNRNFAKNEINDYIAVIDSNDNIEFKSRKFFETNIDNDIRRIAVASIMYTYDANNEKVFLLGQRSLNKKEFPGFLSFTVAGNVDPRDKDDSGLVDFEKALKRETFEETGLDFYNTKNLNLVSTFETQEEKKNEEIKKLFILGTMQVPNNKIFDMKMNEEIMNMIYIGKSDLISELSKPNHERNKLKNLTPTAEQCIQHLLAIDAL